MQVIRYFHLRSYHEEKGGATVKVTGNTEQVGQVDVQFTPVSKKDNYCRNTGRIMASKAPVKVLPLRYLPKELARIAEANDSPSWHHGSFDFSTKYFLPKE
jgi:hypothetical protein